MTLPRTSGSAARASGSPSPARGGGSGWGQEDGRPLTPLIARSGNAGSRRAEEPGRGRSKIEPRAPALPAQLLDSSTPPLPASRGRFAIRQGASL